MIELTDAQLKEFVEHDKITVEGHTLCGSDLKVGCLEYKKIPKLTKLLELFILNGAIEHICQLMFLYYRKIIVNQFMVLAMLLCNTVLYTFLFQVDLCF